MDGKYFLGGIGVIAIAAIEITALYNGIDGAYLSACVGAIGALIGGVVGVTITTKKKEE